MKRKVFKLVGINLACLILVYYVAVLLHEYGHGTTAWLFGYKKSPLDIIYGSWYLIPVDENVNYSALINARAGIQAALIGISGLTVSILLFLLSFFLHK